MAQAHVLFEGELEVIQDIETQVEVPMQPGGNVMWKDLIVTGPTSGVVMQSGHAIKPSECLTYSPAVKLRYLGEMAELNHAELVAMYMLL